MNEIIIEFCEKLRRGVRNDPEAKSLCLELSDIMLNELYQREDVIKEDRIMEFFDLHMQVDKAMEEPNGLDYIRNCILLKRIGEKKVYLTSLDGSQAAYNPYLNICPAYEELALAYAATFFYVRQVEDMRFEIPALMLTRLSLEEKIFFYNIIMPAKRFLRCFKDFLRGVQNYPVECLAYNANSENLWISFVLLDRIYHKENPLLVGTYTLSLMYSFYSDIFHDDMSEFIRTLR